TRGGGGDRRSRAVQGLSGRYLPRPRADPVDPDEPLDHLGLRRLRAAVAPRDPVGLERLQLPDGRLRLRRGLRALRLRSRRRDLAAHARDRRAPERRLRPQDGADGGGRMSAVTEATPTLARPSVERRAAVVRRERRRRLRRAGWNVLGLAVAAVMV